jgi:glycine cleavage system T protein (aminomethyltransferase)
MCQESGGVVDDLYAYRLGPDEFLLIINASRIGDDVDWLWKKLQSGVAVKPEQLSLVNVSDEFGAVAVQGPRVAEFIDDCFPGPSQGGTQVSRISDLKKNQVAKVSFAGGDVWVSRTGYTGEDGFEVIALAAAIEMVWNKILELGAPFGLKPAGLGARDTLRTEVCYPLYGHELTESTTPIEAGLGVFVSLDKGEFVGRRVLAEQKANGVSKRLVAFRMTDKCAPPRPNYPICGTGPNATRLGEVTSGTQSPSLGIGVGLGYVPPESAAAQTLIEIEIRGKRARAVVVPKPIYRKAH